MRKKPDFFLNAAGEHAELSNPRACWVKGRLKDDLRDDYVLIEIGPPLIGQNYGLGDRDMGFDYCHPSQRVYALPNHGVAFLRLYMPHFGIKRLMNRLLVECLQQGSSDNEAKPEETDLLGRWVIVDGETVADQTTQRIETLTKQYLDKVGGGGWETLFRDP